MSATPNEGDIPSFGANDSNAREAVFVPRMGPARLPWLSPKATAPERRDGEERLLG